MIIFSFDSAVKNLGFCCISVNDTWQEETVALIDELNAFYDSIPENRAQTIKQMRGLTKKADTLINSVFEIKYMNIFDLIPGEQMSTKAYANVVRRLKYLLFCLTQQLPKPDIVLIEYQMGANDKSRGISRYIEEYFVGLNADACNEITYSLPAYPLITAEVPDELCIGPEIISVNPNLKNAYQVDSSDAGSYTTFISKYTNYTANKKHTTWNFQYFLKTRGIEDKIEGAVGKLDDVSDAFMQAFAWCKSRKFILRDKKEKDTEK